MKNLAKFAGAAIGVYSSARYIHTATDAFNTQTKAVAGLSGALRNQVADVEAATAAHAEYAAELQRLTTVGDEVTIGIMRRAALLGVEESQLDAVAAATIGVSEATGLGLNESLKKVNETINGNARALGEYLPALKATEDAEEQLRLVTELAEQGLKQKEQSLSRLDGAQARATGAIGDMNEQIGALIAPLRTVVSQGLAVFAETATSALIPAVEWMNSSLEEFGEWSEWAAKVAVGAVTGIEVAFTQAGKAVDLAGTTIALAYVKWTEDAKWAAGVVMEHAEWFGENYGNLIYDVINIANEAFKNMFSTLGTMHEAFFEWLRTGMVGGMAGLGGMLGKAIGESVQDELDFATSALPEIVDRNITEQERALAERMANLGLDIGDAFNSKFASRMKAFEANLAKPRSISVDLSSKLDLDIDDDLKKNASKLNAVESRLLTRGTSDDPATLLKQLLQVQEKQLQAIKDNKPKIEKTPQIPVGNIAKFVGIA